MAKDPKCEIRYAIEAAEDIRDLRPFDDEDLQWYARERDPTFIRSIERARQQAAAGQTIGHEELKKELGLS